MLSPAPGAAVFDKGSTPVDGALSYAL
ncbi:hypothetical protein SAMN04515695_5657, partial [Pseudovibrio sp. Tun.PSC04-5.I4]